MTTKVTVAASGEKYPARIVHVRHYEDRVPETLFDELVASGHSVDRFCATSDVITVTEEYHEAGYPVVTTRQDPPDAPDAAAAD